ncbi:hypothetical protein [Nonomuraea basaltis]|uniref:hypothetical protein n=1 Tax=Nonomuraea basaltis TaxID=2495887 RepID=UPI00110C54B9|nr:hypothetical protein [Nonomuraea basaltis]TMR99913.1 hypothetical protein EJK15_05235 [Nonomuraea basaltis]
MEILRPRRDTNPASATKAPMMTTGCHTTWTNLRLSAAGRQVRTSGPAMVFPYVRNAARTLLLRRGWRRSPAPASGI